MKFSQVDVFTDKALLGNPLAVVHGADDLSDAQMRAFAAWTNLSETTFLLKPSDPAADYRVRIFTPRTEFLFAGHPTLGSCHAWLEEGGMPRDGKTVVQQCGVGLVKIAQLGQSRAAFAAPPSQRAAVRPADIGLVAEAIGITPSDVQRAMWLTNGSGWWFTLMLADARQVLALEPEMGRVAALARMPAHEGRRFDHFGLIAPHAAGAGADFEVRALGPAAGFNEDPVTGSLNAAVAQWLMDEGLAPESYIAAQGSAIGRAGRVSLERRDGVLWVGGSSVTCVRGEVRL